MGAQVRLNPGGDACRSGGRWLGGLLRQPGGQALFLGAAARGAKCCVRSWSEAGTAGGALRSHHLLRPQAPPLPPPSSSSPPARPIRSPRPRRAGLLVWPAEAERDLS